MSERELKVAIFIAWLFGVILRVFAAFAVIGGLFAIIRWLF